MLKPHNVGTKRVRIPGAGIMFQPMSRPGAEKGQAPSDETASPPKDGFPSQPSTDVTLLAKMLAAAGGGAVSQDLALDLVLNEVVADARKATRASGAAIALMRDGRMICRATTGNAPDLGVSVETESGISGACLITGSVQLCSDTDLDPRVNAEACRRLNVGSMLMAPISDGKQNFGIVEVFSDQRNAFTEEDVKTLQILAQRVADSKKASEEGLKGETPPAANPGSPPGVAAPSSTEVNSHESEPPAFLPEQPDKGEFLTSVLVVLVIAVAVVLGVVIGVGFTNRNVSRATAQSGAVSAQRAPQPGTGTPPQAGAPTSLASSESSAADAAAQRSPSAVPAEPPAGGLMVTQNGKVIYRSDSPAGVTAAVAPRKSSSRLVHQVNPVYPEAARTQHIEGPVVLNAHVLGDGSVGEIEIVAGHPLLAEAATQAVRQWKFQPYSVNGRPVERQERITVRFSLPSS